MGFGGPSGFHLHIDQSAQADAQRRNALGEKLGIGNQRDIRLQLLGIFSHVFGNGFAAHLLLAFHQKLHVDGQRAVYGAQRLDGFHVHVHLAFIVRRTASVNIAVAHFRLEGRAEPFTQRIGRLHVVVAVAQHGGLAGRVHPICIDQRMLGGGDDLDILHAHVAQAVGHELRGALDIAAVLGQRADAGNAQELLQLFEEPAVILFDKCVCSFGH